MILAFDFDNVLANFAEILRYEVFKRKGEYVRWCDYIDYNLHEKHGLTDSELADIIIKYHSSSIHMLEPVEPPDTVRRVVEALAKVGLEEVLVVSHQPIKCDTHIYNWIRHWYPFLIDYNLQVFTLEPQISKSEIDFDILVDDKPENCLDVVEAGSIAYLYDRPWNQGFGNEQHGIKRIHSLSGILETGHPRFSEILDELKALHMVKNIDYSTWQDPLQNFRRVGEAVRDFLPRVENKAAAVAYFYMMKQVDAVGNLLASGKSGMAESVSSRLNDIAVYAILARILVEEGEQVENSG